ncbi:MAG: phenylalanine--tRNA ligase subunit beta, partial [Magnetococcales bacterium]|nr:phenylalanine--tRNA ligase subunit beta [Magnetococcales bacterium]
ARIGAHLPNDLKIKKGKLRGQLSEGMLCSVTELGMAEAAEGILILPEDTPVGLPIAEALQRHDHLLEVDLTPNRGDCLGVRGIARDLGASIGSKLKPMVINFTVDDTVDQRHPMAVKIEDAEGCPRYAGRVIEGVKIGPSPDALRFRLEKVGLRSINNVVDITNLILLDLNQPLHAFDLAQLKPPLVVRRAANGEVLETLDEVERTLTDQMTLIADQNQGLALAGIMGGQNSGITDGTTDIFLESAYFEPVRTARTGRRLNIVSDSRYRFERGTDPYGIQFALDRATQLILEMAGGKAGSLILEDAGTWMRPSPVPFRPERANQLGGISLEHDEMERMLIGLGCELSDSAPPSNNFHAQMIQPPSHRHDLKREEDLVEEIIRLFGYDRVPSTMPHSGMSAEGDLAQESWADRLRDLWTGLGYLEAVNYAFVDRATQTIFDPNREAEALLNPISEEQAVMRTTLMPGLIQTAIRNLNQGNAQLRLFETGAVFHLEQPGVTHESDRLSGLITGPIRERNWHGTHRESDLYDLKGDLETFLARLNRPEPQFRAAGPEFLHPGRRAEILLDDAVVGWMGQLHPGVQSRLGIGQAVLLFELDTEALQAHQAEPQSASKTRFPSIQRDFAFIVPESLAARELTEVIQGVDRSLVRQVMIFDVYTGSQVPEGQKSLAIGVVLQAEERTLTDAEAQNLSDSIVGRLTEQFGAQLRG